MIEGVDGVPCVWMPREATRHLDLDGGGLDLHVHGRARPDKRQHVVQRRHRFITAEPDGPQGLVREVCNRHPRGGAVGPDHRHVGIVMDNDRTTRGGVDIQLDPIGAVVQGHPERRQGVFEGLARRATMRDDLRDAGHRYILSGWRGRMRSGRLARRLSAEVMVHLNSRPCASSIVAERMTESEPEDDAALDRALIEQWQAGDERAATQLVVRHAPALSRYAVRLGMADEADELVQDTFIRAFGALDAFRAESSLRTWLFTIERRLVIDRRRASARRANDVDVADDELASTDYNALDGLVADETSQRVQQAMGTLTRMQREVFTLRVQEDRSYKEIAEILETSEGAARVHYHNAMRAVKEFLHG